MAVLVSLPLLLVLNSVTVMVKGAAVSVMVMVTVGTAATWVTMGGMDVEMAARSRIKASISYVCPLYEKCLCCDASS